MNLNLQNLKLELTFFGEEKFELDKFIYPRSNPARRARNKPIGGLWASPTNATYGWKHWCKDNDFHLEKLESHFNFEYFGKTAVIESEADLDSKLIWNLFAKSIDFEAIDFEAMIEAGCDAIYLTEDGQANTRLTYPKNLYTWDCECVLILNSDCVILN